MSRYLNLIVTGFMATGKTTIGEIVAKNLQCRFIDLDHEIVVSSGMEISDFFGLYGEEKFRDLESQTLMKFADEPATVIATGGGTLVSEKNFALVPKNSLVICLFASYNTLQERLQKSSQRPLAKNWESLWRQRLAIYEKMPNHIQVDNKTPQQIAQEVIQLWQN